MFPYCNVSVSGLVPYAKYFIMVDMVPADNSRYKVGKKNNQRLIICCKCKINVARAIPLNLQVSVGNKFTLEVCFLYKQDA